MTILTNNFYKFLFSFVGVILLSLAFIFVAGILNDSPQENQPSENLAGDCGDNSEDC